MKRAEITTATTEIQPTNQSPQTEQNAINNYMPKNYITQKKWTSFQKYTKTESRRNR